MKNPRRRDKVKQRIKKGWGASFRNRILGAFILTSIIPVLILVTISYLNFSGTMRKNIEELIHLNLQQTKKSLDVWMDSYDDILFQAYMDDEIVDMVDDLNHNRDTTTTEVLLRRTLQGMIYTKKYIRAISVITKEGKVVFYDSLTGSVMKNSWSEGIGYSNEELFDMISADNTTHVFSTGEAGTYAGRTYRLFHIGHRIIDYQNLGKQLGVVIVSIDEELLREICLEEKTENTYKFIVDKKGNLVSGKEEEIPGTKIIEWTDDMTLRRQAYLEYLEKSLGRDRNGLFVDVEHDELFGWDIVGVSDRNQVMGQLKAQQKLILLMMGIMLLILAIMIRVLIRDLMHSINELVEVMKHVEQGDIHARAEVSQDIPTEIGMISGQFNRTLDELEDAMEKQKEAAVRQRNAEIAALEAQINPHFLYNTLDTINWMAIDRGEYEISNSITSLAAILRYGLDNSNGLVTIKKEAEWLKQYLFLQQTRMKEAFECCLNIPPQVMEYRVHKLLFQPFVENSILHGFEGKKGKHILKIGIEQKEDDLEITIWDNGKGMPKELVERMNRGEFPDTREKNCIGMENAITRISMYYGEKAGVQIESVPGEYTNIRIRLLTQQLTGTSDALV
ncbi:MAG: HAMP domain-containing protein [Lachnospiraceae bacterium]|nr:HAMP domain-containing protein [Lachnospiraceae bacterium]